MNPSEKQIRTAAKMYEAREIAEDDGRVWDFERSIGEADSIELRTLAPDECVISPGLIYKRRRPVVEVSNG